MNSAPNLNPLSIQTISSQFRFKRVIALKKPTVYLVDPDLSALEEMQTLLSVLDVEIEKFTSAESFLLNERRIESTCLVVNFNLPGLSGLALLEELRERDICIPIVLIDNLGDVRRAVKAMRAGVVEYIEKPFADRLLLKAVGDAINALNERDPGGV